MGHNTFAANTTGAGNCAFGIQTLYANTTSNYNTAMGYTALTANTTGAENVAIGGFALDACVTGDYNTAVGTSSLGAATGNLNSALGRYSGQDLTSGGGNTFIGTESGKNATTGDNNTGVGYLSFGIGIITGDDNTALGRSTGYNLTSGANNLFAGHDSGLTGSPGGNVTTGSNEIYLGDENIGSANIQVDWTVASDQRDKTDFTDLDLGLDFVKALAPVTYKWDKRSKYGDKYADDYDLNAQTPDGTHKEDWLDIGFKAQAVQALEEAAGYTTAAKKNLTVSTSGDGKQLGLQYSKFVPILVKAIQEQNALIEALTARITTLEG
jgi:hypothetical protein